MLLQSQRLVQLYGVKASTKPWPRQLGSSIMRALPPQSQAGPGQVSPPKAYIDIFRARDGQHEEKMSVEHVGHVSAAVDRRTSSTPSRAARAAIAPNDDVHLVAASPTCSSQLIQERRGGEAQALDFFVRLAAASRRAA